MALTRHAIELNERKRELFDKCESRIHFDPAYFSCFLLVSFRCP